MSPKSQDTADAVVVATATDFTDAVIEISGAKNAALPAVLGTLLLRGRTELTNVPTDLSDLASAIRILEHFGLRTTIDQEGHRLTIINDGVRYRSLPRELSHATRYASLLIGVLTGLFGRARVALPGGCRIGKERPIDIHLDGLREFGVAVTEDDAGVETLILGERECLFRQRYPSVGATLNLAMFLLSSRVPHTLDNCATEPEVASILTFFNNAGAEISGVGLSRIRVLPSHQLTAREHEIIPDRIEVGTYALLAALIERNITLRFVTLEHIRSILDVLDQLGIPYEYRNKRRELEVLGREARQIRPLRIRTGVYPGFPTDLQPILAALCLKARGESEIVDTVFPDRFGYVEELRRLGADMEVDGPKVRVRESIGRLQGATLRCPDLRGGMAALFAVLLGDGGSILEGASQLLRGYDRLKANLGACGIDLRSINHAN